MIGPWSKDSLWPEKCDVCGERMKMATMERCLSCVIDIKKWSPLTTATGTAGTVTFYSGATGTWTKWSPEDA